ncbi:MAG: hypothetical protein OXT69_13195 [Candidatus Poribacteria bacterium]|nr:hypothetical protein [Candidatus Poribacteria bacterium]
MNKKSIAWICAIVLTSVTVAVAVYWNVLSTSETSMEESIRKESGESELDYSPTEIVVASGDSPSPNEESLTEAQTNDPHEESRGISVQDRWEKHVDYHIDTYLRAHGEEDNESLAKMLREGYEKYRGAPIAELPNASIINRDMVLTQLREMLKSGDISQLSIGPKKTWDSELNAWRTLEPAIHVRFSKIKKHPSGGFSYTSEALYSVDGERELTPEEEYELLFRGVFPEGINVIYIGEDGERLSPDKRPTLHGARMDAFRKFSDEQLAHMVETIASWTPHYEMSPIDWMKCEDAVSVINEVWAERSDASRKQYASIAADSPLAVPQTPLPKIAGDDGSFSLDDSYEGPESLDEGPESLEKPSLSETHLFRPPSEEELNQLLEEMKRAMNDKNLTESERNALKERREAFLRWQEMEQQRRLRRSQGAPPFSEEPHQ